VKHRVVELYRTENEEGVIYTVALMTTAEIAGANRASTISVTQQSFDELRPGDIVDVAVDVIREESPFSAELSPAEREPEWRDCVLGLQGLLQLICGRDDVPADLMRVVAENHRWIEAERLTGQAEVVGLGEEAERAS